MFSIISVCLLDPSPSAFWNLHHRHPACCIMSDIFHMLWILICGINKIFWSLGRYDPPLKVLQQHLQATSDWWRSIKVLWSQCQRAAYSHLQRFLYFGPHVCHVMGICSEGRNSYSIKRSLYFFSFLLFTDENSSKIFQCFYTTTKYSPLIVFELLNSLWLLISQIKNDFLNCIKCQSGPYPAGLYYIVLLNVALSFS